MKENNQTPEENSGVCCFCKMKKIQILSDVFDISSRIKQLDENLFLCFDRKKQKLEVHQKNIRPTLLFTLPFSSLTARVLPFVAHRLHQSVQQAVIEVDQHNEKVQNQRTQKVIDDAHDELKDIISFAQSGSKDFIKKDENPWV